MSITEIKAIDVHSHFGEWDRVLAPKESQPFFEGGLDYLLQNMEYANIGISINSHLYSFIPRGYGDSYRCNQLCFAAVQKNPSLYMWAVVNPLQPETYAQAKDLLQHEKCLGVKVHPEEHRYPLRAYGAALYEFAAKNKAAIEGHSGEEWSLPEDYGDFANHYPEVTTIISHMGCGWDGDFRHQIKAIQANRNNNLFTDTSSAKSINCNLIEIGVSEIGSERILFGTDSSCYFSPSQRARVDFARIADQDKKNILYLNVLRLFPQLEKAYRSLSNE